MDRPAAPPWSLARSLAFLAAVFAIVIGATLPTAVAASPAGGHPLLLCSGEQVLVVEDASGRPVRQDPAPVDSLDCSACLAAAMVSLAAPPPVAAPAPPVVRPVALPSAQPRADRPVARTALRPPSTAPPHA